jgi:hypothetical protein
MKLIILFASMLLTEINLLSQVSAPSIETAFKNYLQAESGHVYTGSGLPVFLIKEDTKGNRYLYEKWVNGSVLGVDGVVYNSSKYLFNYDKIGQKLLMLLDSSKMLELNSGDIAGFTLRDDTSQYHFERLKNSTDLNFYQPISKNEKGYSFYKLTKTKFMKADYQSNGIVESGRKYDEYVDEEQFFILSAKQELTRLDFKKKSLEKVFESDASKLQVFFDQHKGEKINEEFVTSLVQFLNTH